MTNDSSPIPEEFRDARCGPEADWWPDSLEEQELMMLCALRFDGGGYDAELSRDRPDCTYGNLAHLYTDHEAQTFHPHEDLKHQMGVMFWLQRSLKWGDGLPDRESLMYVWLFIQLHGREVPGGWECQDYLTQYECRRDDARRLAANLSPLVERAIRARFPDDRPLGGPHQPGSYDLQVGKWYHLFICDGGEVHPSPILIREAKRTGRNRLTLHFLHAWYPAGAQEKEYALRLTCETPEGIDADSLDTKGRRLMIRAAEKWVGGGDDSVHEA
ncbi:MAG: hypothetical protein H7A55_06030 [Verrucomicrobiaceae bacterium]|nr:hypothetical protein [Verrucomicrobiaceae bacterium]